MKKTFLLLIFLPLISSLCAQNQTDKGRILLSTSSATSWNSSLIGVGTSQNKGYADRNSSSAISLSPGVS